MALTDNLQAFYKLSDTSDSSGNNRTLTNNGNVSFASGKIGNAAVFDGTNWLENSGITFANPFSIGFWIKGQSDQGTVGIFGNWGEFGEQIAIVSQGNELNVSLRFSDGGFVPFFSGWGGSVSGPNPTDGAWHHVIITYDGTNGKVMFDGAQIASEILGNISTNVVPITIGKIQMTSYGFVPFNGQIDAVGIWNRALSDAEVAELYNNGTGLELEGSAAPTLVKMQAPVKFMGKVKFGV
jgi:hypothetical protein